MRVPLENSAYFGDGDGFNSNPEEGGLAWDQKDVSQ